jgi:hypothetical protein
MKYTIQLSPRERDLLLALLISEELKLPPSGYTEMCGVLKSRLHELGARC